MKNAGILIVAAFVVLSGRANAACDRAAADTGDLAAAWDCDRADYRAADSDLNKIYDKIVGKLKKQKDSKRLSQLQADEKAWWKSKPKCLGKVESREEATSKLSQCLDMTKDRVEKLKADFKDVL